MKEYTFATIAIFVSLATAEVPSYMKVCGRRNPKLDECVLDSVASLKEKLKAGIPELDVPSMEPLFISKVALADLPNFKAFATNVSLYGLSDFKPKKLHVDLEKQKILIEVDFKTVRLTGDYDVNAKILVPIAGGGPIDITNYDVRSKVVMNYKLVTSKGKEYLFFPSMTTKLSIKDYTADFAPKEGPESPLATAINAALTNSRQEILEGTIPNVEKTISVQVLAIANNICKHFTYDELFPDHE